MARHGSPVKIRTIYVLSCEICGEDTLDGTGCHDASEAVECRRIHEDQHRDDGSLRAWLRSDPVNGELL